MMKIVKLDKTHKEKIFSLFEVTKYMGVKVEGSGFAASSQMARVYHAGFSSTYLVGLKSYHAFGAFDDDDNCVGLIACYQNPDDASWYGTQIRSNSKNTDVIKDLLDTMIKFNEERGRFKFYTLWNKRHGKLLRSTMFSEWAEERYDYFDELEVPAKTKCLYNTYWQVLFNRILLPQDSIIRCTFLKQKYREGIIPIAGNI